MHTLLHVVLLEPILIKKGDCAYRTIRQPSPFSSLLPFKICFSASLLPSVQPAHRLQLPRIKECFSPLMLAYYRQHQRYMHCLLP